MNLMTLLKRIASTVGCVVLAALLLALVAPKAVHGVVAALVQVSNTPSNPVATLDASATFPFFAQFQYDTRVGVPNPAFVVPPYVPNGMRVQRLIIEQVAGTCYIADGFQNFYTSLITNNTPGVFMGPQSGVEYILPVVPVSPSNSTNQFAVGPTLVHIVVVQGGTVSMGQQPFTNGTADDQASCTLTVTGHYEAQ